jgi:hypothetical protein
MPPSPGGIPGPLSTSPASAGFSGEHVSQHASEAVTSAEGQSPVGHWPELV